MLPNQKELGEGSRAVQLDCDFKCPASKVPSLMPVVDGVHYSLLREIFHGKSDTMCQSEGHNARVRTRKRARRKPLPQLSQYLERGAEEIAGQLSFRVKGGRELIHMCDQISNNEARCGRERRNNSWK